MVTSVAQFCISASPKTLAKQSGAILLNRPNPVLRFPWTRLLALCFTNAGKDNSNFQAKERLNCCGRYSSDGRFPGSGSLTLLACGLSITTIVVLGVLYGVANPFQPLTEDLFRCGILHAKSPNCFSSLCML
ncbi:uncharacterized protein LOC111288582 [Durio zibethinus]|uniref:Uncharacterized protein LOC111288582 n=1 Tax=Durio zibethinus TaxID=66656 RepID=A0A6P5Y4B7_DURZI|nr:uncharacterized protein LOC111288582 [Durio zibethinus]